MKIPLNRILTLSCLIFALVLAATLALHTTNARPDMAQAKLAEVLSLAQTPRVLASAKTAVGPRVTTDRLVSPFDWRSHRLITPTGGALVAPLITASKSAVLATDLNNNGLVNPGDTLMYSVVVSNTGADAALNVVFTDTLDANLTLVGAAAAAPIVVNDSYASIGNVGLTVNAANGLLANDVNPQGTGTLTASAGATSAQGGAVSVNGDGSFSYNPPAGYEGTDSFNYLLTHSNGKTDSGTVSLTVSGMIWFINNNSSCSSSCNGRLSHPFTSLAAFNTANALGGSLNPDNNDNIFIYESSTQSSGAVTLRTGQKLIGQDATASLATIAGISVPPFSTPLPAMNSGNATLTNLASTVRLNSNATVRGLTINSTTSTGLDDPVDAITGVSVNEVAVATTTGTAVNLSNAGGTFSFISIASNGAVNGILLANTTGSFSVTGSGGPGSGGTIQNSTGDGVSLTNAVAVSLSSVNITGSGNHGINANAVNGLTLNNCQLTNSGNADNEHGLNLVNATGTVTINGTTFNNAAENLVHLDNTNTNVSFNVTNNSQFSYPSSIGTFANSAILLIPKGSAAITASIQNAVFTNIKNAAAQIAAGAAGSNGTQSFTFSNNTINVSLSGRASSVVVSGQEATTTNLTISNNNFTGAGGNGVISLDTNDTAITSGTVAGNTITNAPGIGIYVAGDEGSTTRVVVNGNTITNAGSDGIEAVNFGGAGISNKDIAITNNTVNGSNTNPAAAFIGGIVFFGFEDNSCVVLRGNNVTGTPTDPTRCGGVPCVDYYLEEGGGTTILEEVPNTVKTVADAAYIQSINSPATASVTIFGTIDLSNGATCAGPFALFAPPRDKSSDQLGGQPATSLTAQAEAATGSASAPSFLAQLREWLNPVFTAFGAPQSYVKLDLAFSKVAETIAPSASAAESGFASAGDAKGLLGANQPAQTLLINSKGQYSIVPTAAIPASFAGETITINGGGGGFTLPPGESTTIMFNAQVANPLPAGVCQVSNQATVMGSNFATVMSNNVLTNVEAPPIITGVAALTRQQGSAASNSQIATVDDCNQAENTLVVTVNGGASALVNGVTVSNIVVAANGNVTADVVAACTATNATFTLTTTDSSSQTATTNLTVNVTPNTPPTLGSYPNTGPINVGAGAIVTPSAAPTDNGTVTTLTASAPGFAGTFSGNATTGVITITNASPAGTYTVTVTATDTCLATTTATFQLVVNDPPTITGATISRQQGSAASNSQIATVNDTDQAENTLVVTVNGGTSATVNGVTVSSIVVAANGNVTADVVAACTATNATFTLTVTDSASASANATLTVNVAPNTPPTLGNYPTTSVTPGASTTVTPSAAPTDNGTVTTLTASAPGFAGTFSGNATTGVITITNANPPGTYTVTVTATDNCLATTMASFTLNVNCPTITVNPASLPNGTAGASYSQLITATPEGGNYSFAVTSGSLPPGLTLASNGTLSGTPTTMGTFSFTITATGFGTCTGTRSYTITINCPTITITPSSLPNTSRGALYNQTLNVTPAGSYSFALSSGSLPPGLSLNATSGVISGTPTTNGSYSFTVTATGFGSCTASRSYTISVNGQCPNVTQHDNLPNGTVNTPYFGSLSHVTPTNDYIITLQAGTLPPGLTIDNVQKALVGTPTTAGSYTFTLRATAPSGCYDDRIYTVVISSSAAIPSDFDGDRKADPAVFRSAQADWLLNLSSTNRLETPSWGAPGDHLAAGDYDGDGKIDLAVFCPADSHWRIKRSSDGATLERAWGTGTDVPVPADYDGDGKTDLALWRSQEGTWYIFNSSDATVRIVPWNSGAEAQFDVPVPADYDGDNKTDLAVFNKQEGNWYIQRSSDGAMLVRQWGMNVDTPVPADYDGDGKADLAVWRGEQGAWYISRSSDNTQQTAYLGASFAPYLDVPAPADYDGDGKTDIAVWRAAQGTWYSRNSSDGALRTLLIGQPGDTPVTSARAR